MSYTYLLEQGEESSAECFSDMPRCVLSRLNLTADESYSNGSGTESCHDSPSGTTSELLTGSRGEGESMSSAVGSPARTSPSLEKEPGSTESVPACGQRWPVSFAKWDRDSSSWRTRQLSVFGGSVEYSETWPEWGIQAGGESSAVPTPEALLSVSVCGLYPGPLKAQAKRGWGMSLSGRARFGELICDNVRKDIAEFGWKLNPRSHEWLMGWPIGWTNLRPLATDKFQQWLHSHGDFLEVQ